MERVKLSPVGDKRGGPRAGSGRPRGSNHAMSQVRDIAAQAHVEAGGMMPVDFMLLVLRNSTVAGGRGKQKWEFSIGWEDKKWAADRLLNCFTPKLTSTTLQGTVQVFALPPEALKNMTPEELLVMEKALGKLAPPSAGNNISTSNFSSFDSNPTIIDHEPVINNTNGHKANGYANKATANAYAEALGETLDQAIIDVVDANNEDES